MTKQTKQELANRAVFRRDIGLELRRLRESYNLSQAMVGEVLGYNRDAVSKLERGTFPIDLFDYLRLMHFYRDRAPNHPAVALAARMLPNVPRLPLPEHHER
jgi:transcriptional regulator with XRE-family HTH domain